MEPLTFIALIAIVVAVRLFAARQVARGDRRFLWLVFAPTLLILASPLVAAGMMILNGQPLIGIGLAVVGVTTIVLLVRVLRPMASQSIAKPTGELSAPGFDYIIWMSIGIPLLLVGALLVLLISGNLTSR